MNKKEKVTYFGKNLILWNLENNSRKMPWKAIKDPYKIWLSEIILQQTRVEQGLAYYNKFIKKYPTINKLASAPDDEIFKMWEGLGYYSRCKNLIATARYVSYELGGVFPNVYEQILGLKGIGPYTAAAIGSFAFNLPFAVVDGNVLRVLARFFGKDIPIDSPLGKKYFNELAQNLLDKSEPGLYNQAIMDFGATVCKPQLPLCEECMLSHQCIAYKKNKVKELPVKVNKLIKKHRFFYYIIASFNGLIYVKKREGKDIWQNLWEFILLEQQEKVAIENFLKSPAFLSVVGKNAALVNVSDFYKQQLTHQTIEGCFILVELKTGFRNGDYHLLSKSEISQLAFPRFITNYFEKTGRF
jgi:A/G-specific adenine glycosylase